jgi:hypothetical protein
MSDVLVSDLLVGRADAAGRLITAIYARKLPIYCVYRTDENVAIQYADDPAMADEQRKALAPLFPARSEITGLVDGWRNTPEDKHFLWIKTGTKLRSKAAAYDRRVGYALVDGLEGDLTGGGALLAKIKDDIISERIGWARFEYLLMAYCVSALLTAVSVLVSLVDETNRCGLGSMLCFDHAWDLWRGAAAGALGAFFSIALAIRGRTILPDLYRTSNLMDAALRIIIGSIAGVVLVGLIDAGFVRFAIGDSKPGVFETIHILLVGFIGGFAERLVPDLLAKAEAQTGEQPVIRRPETDASAPPARNPPGVGGAAGGAGGGGGAPPPAAPPAPPLAPEEADEDACVADLQLGDEDVTADEDLPAASGGVQRDGSET